MPLRQIKLLCDAVVELLKSGNRPAWEIEDELAQQFRVTKGARYLSIVRVSGLAERLALKLLVERAGLSAKGRKAPMAAGL